MGAATSRRAVTCKRVIFCYFTTFANVFVEKGCRLIYFQATGCQKDQGFGLSGRISWLKGSLHTSCAQIAR